MGDVNLPYLVGGKYSHFQFILARTFLYLFNFVRTKVFEFNTAQKYLKLFLQIVDNNKRN